ncbi:unnamed protein product [Effrenium voratum]|nr:unnamed protein product [Effrenium voratum]
MWPRWACVLAVALAERVHLAEQVGLLEEHLPELKSCEDLSGDYQVPKERALSWRPALLAKPSFRCTCSARSPCAEMSQCSETSHSSAAGTPKACRSNRRA